MAAFDTPWMNSMPASTPENEGTGEHTLSGEAPVYAAFSPGGSSHATSHTRQRSTVLINQKSPLLVATPPVVTRALAHSHPFILPLNKVVGLLSWSSGDPWESFLMVAVFWLVTLYGDNTTRVAGPLVFSVCLIVGMYSRRFSPLSSSSWSSWTKTSKSSGSASKDSKTGGESAGLRKARRSSISQRKSLDEILETLRVFTARCNILLEPFLQLTDFLSTQNSATSATTRPALTAFFLRILLVSPLWFLLTLPPFYIITTRRVVLTLGTLGLSWHSRPARVSRTILWRSRFVRETLSVVTGLSFTDPATHTPTRKHKHGEKPRLPPRTNKEAAAAHARYHSRGRDRGSRGSSASSTRESIRFTFALYENQRRWIGIGWTQSMLAYERAPWTDEQLNAAESKNKFRLPAVEGGLAKWQWVPGSQWEIEEPPRRNNQVGDDNEEDDAATKRDETRPDADQGWIYYDNKWQGNYDHDAWGRYTRRRKWVRDAELVDLVVDDAGQGSAASSPARGSTKRRGDDEGDDDSKTRTAVPSPGLLSPHDAEALAASTKEADASGVATPSSAKPKAFDATAYDSDASSRRSSMSLGWFARRAPWLSHSRSQSASVSRTPTGLDANGIDANDVAAKLTAAANRPRSDSRASTATASTGRAPDDDDGYIPLRYRGRQGPLENLWGLGEDVGMDLG